ncbi:DUF2062 domain-containing protein [Candidatus Sumerlaeota bacterium]|nr:DUF2062 domain-containing protein [Candidatus Sumerlaeota bacterium]
MKKRLRGAWLHRVFGEHLLRAHLWVHDRRAIAGGLALGLFVAFTPTFPAQMLLAALGAIYFRVNLPVALTACWVTNPLTLGPVYLASWRLGRFILEKGLAIDGVLDVFFHAGRMRSIAKQSACLWTGSLVLASVAALLAYGAVWVFWAMAARWTARKRADADR